MSAGSRISVEIGATSSELQAAAAKAADSLKGLGDVLARQTDIALSAGDKSVRMNEVLARSYQQAAATAIRSTQATTDGVVSGVDKQVGASDKLIASLQRQGAVVLKTADQQISASDRSVAAMEAQATAAQRSASEQARANDLAAASAQRSADRQVAAAMKSKAAFGSSSSALTKSGKVISLGLLGAAAASVVLGVKFQSNTLRMQTQAGATAAQLAKLRKGLLDMAAVVGYTPDQLATGMYHVVSSMNAVLPAAQRVSTELAVMKAAAEGAQVGHANLEDTTYALASAMNALHLRGNQAQHTMGQVNAIVGAGDMTMQDFVDSLKSGLLPAAAESHVSLQSLGAAEAVMGDMGMRGALAGTRLRMAIALLSSPSAAAAKVLQTLGLSATQAASTSEAMSKALEKAGLRTTRLSADLRKPDGIEVALHDLDQHLRQSGLTATGAAAVMSKAFGGARTGATITLLAQNTGRLQTKFEQVGQSAGQFGHDFQATTHTLGFELHSLEGGAEALGTEIGTVLIPIVAGGVRDIESFAHWLGKGSAAAHALELAVGTLATVAIGSYLVSKLRSAVTLMREFAQLTMHPVQSVGGFVRSTAPTPVTGTGISAAEAQAGGIWGARGPIKPGSLANPLIVAMEAGEYAGLGSMGAARTTVAATGGEAAAASAGVTGVLSTLKGGLASLLKGGLIAAGGDMAAHLAGGFIGGKTGHAVSRIGGDAAIGAGLGSFVGPEGTLAGGVLGGLVGAFATFNKSDATKYGEQMAKKFTAPLPQDIQKQTSAAISHSASAYKHATDAITNGPKPEDFVGFGNPASFAKVNAAHLAELKKQAFNFGWTVGNSTVAGLKSVKTPTTSIFLGDFEMQLKKLPAQARPEAARVMLEFAAGLEQNGRLPKGAVSKIITGIEYEFPALQASLKKAGAASAQELATAMQFDGAKTALAGTIENVRQQYGLWQVDSKITGQNILSNLTTEMEQLQNVVYTSTGKTRDGALKNLGQLRDQAVAYFDTMGQQVAAASGQMAGSVADGSQKAYQAGAQNFGKLQTSVATAESNMTISTSKGLTIITTALNAVLKAFGEKPLSAITVASASPAQLGAVADGQVSSGGLAEPLNQPIKPHATGGLVQFGQPGARGKDTIPVNMGGVPIAVGSGEQAAVFTHQQQKVANSYLSPIGGLPGLFSSVSAKHYMAGGGIVPGAGGGTESYGQLEGLWIAAAKAMGHPNLASIAPVMAAIAEAESSGIVTNTNPSGASGLWQILGVPFPGNVFDPFTNARMAVAKYLSQGYGAWTTYTSGAYRSFLHGNVPAVAGALGAMQQIAAPKVTGSGTMADIVRGALGLATKGANSFLASRAPAAGPGVGGGFAAGPTGGGFSPAQLGAFDGLQVAKWIIPELEWARAHGWAGRVTSGWRSPTEVVHGVFATAPQGQSEHRLDIYPGGAVDVSDYQQFAQIIAGYPGSEKLIQLGIDPLHFSGTGHAAGGFTADSLHVPKASKPKTPHVGKAPHAKSTGMTPQDLQALGAVGVKLQGYEKDLTRILGGSGGGSSGGIYGSLSSRFQTVEGSAQYLNPDGSINASGYAKKVADDQTLLGYLNEAFWDYMGELPIVTGALHKWLGKQNKDERSIRVDTSKVDANKRKLAANRIKEASIRAAILDLGKPTANVVGALEDKITGTRQKYDPAVKAAERANSSYHGKNKTVKHGLQAAVGAAHKTEQDALSPLESSLLAARISQQRRAAAIKAKTFGLRQQLSSLSKEDVQIEGADTGLGQTVSKLKGFLSGADGTQSANHTVALLETIAANLGMVKWGSGGAFKGIDWKNQGAIYTTQTEIIGLENDIGQAKSAQTVSTTTDNSAQVQLLQQMNLQLSEALALNRSQTTALTSMIPEIPHYDQGGPVMRDTLAQVHGGEFVVPRGGVLVSNSTAPAPNVTIEHHWHGAAGELASMMDSRIQHPENVRVVSRMIGQRTSMLRGAPGSRR